MEKIGKICIGSCIVVAYCFLVAALLTLSNVGNIVQEFVPMREWHADVIGDNAPGAGASGWLMFYVYPHQATGETTYASNLTASNAYEYTDVNDSHAGDNVPYGTAFDLVIKVRWNRTHSWASNNGSYVLEWVEGWCNCSDLSISSTEMSEMNISGTTNNNFIWVHYYLNNSNAGYTITRNQNVSPISFNFNAYY